MLVLWADGKEVARIEDDQLLPAFLATTVPLKVTDPSGRVFGIFKPADMPEPLIVDQTGDADGQVA